MDKAKIVVAVQAELRRHTWGTFIDEPPSVAQGGKGVAVTGCTACRIRTNNNAQYLKHLSDDVLPQILDRVLADDNQ